MRYFPGNPINDRMLGLFNTNLASWSAVLESSDSVGSTCVEASQQIPHRTAKLEKTLTDGVYKEGVIVILPSNSISEIKDIIVSYSCVSKHITFLKAENANSPHMRNNIMLLMFLFYSSEWKYFWVKVNCTFQSSALVITFCQIHTCIISGTVTLWWR